MPIVFKEEIKNKRIKLCLYQQSNGITYVDYYPVFQFQQALQMLWSWNRMKSAEDAPSIILEDGRVYVH